MEEGGKKKKRELHFCRTYEGEGEVKVLHFLWRSLGIGALKDVEVFSSSSSLDPRLRRRH